MIKNSKNKVEIETIPEGYVKNPETGKLIKIGGKLYNQLLQGQQPNTQSKIISNHQSHNEALKQKHKLQQEAPLENNQIYAIGNDRKKVLIKNKKSKSMKIDDMSDLVATACDRVHKKLINQYNEDEIEDNNENRKLFKQMIKQELVLLKQSQARPQPQIQKKQPKQPQYEQSSESDYDDSD